MAGRSVDPTTVERQLAEAGYTMQNVSIEPVSNTVVLNVTGPWSHEEFVDDHEPVVKRIALIATDRKYRRRTRNRSVVPEVIVGYLPQASPRRSRRCQCRRRR